MKWKLTLSFVLVSHALLFGQKATLSDKYYQEGTKYLMGAEKPLNIDMAKKMFWQGAALKDSRAMIQLGLIYGSPNSITKNSDSAIFWFQAGAAHGNFRAYYLLGRVYQLGIDVAQDFLRAAHYYMKGVEKGESYSKNALGYLHFKGLGVKQDYKKAFSLFESTAFAGLPNSMYFLGICYRNGYGTDVDVVRAKYWLRLASLEGESSAMHEMYEEPLPENISAVSARLEEEAKKLRDYKEKFHAGETNNYEGTYTGVAIYYDWSGNYVTEIIPLQLDLKKQFDGYNGVWREGNADAAVSMRVSKNEFYFSPLSVYTRNNHYSARKNEVWQFRDAKLNLSFINDSTQLSGYVQFYSPARKEPGKPLQIILKKKTDTDPTYHLNNLQFSLSPNPATSQTTLGFVIQQSAKVNIKIFSLDGRQVFTEIPRLLPAGNYNITLPVARLASGSYTVQLIVNNQSGSKILLKQ